MMDAIRYALSLVAACGLLFASAGTAAAQPLVLVESGANPAPIILFENAPPRTRAAAEELAVYIEKISGARPELLEGEPDPLPAQAIWVGYQPVLDELFPEQDFEFEHPEEILIAANDRHLVIAGRDRWDEDNMTLETRRGTFEGMQQEYGTVNAVYTFLQNHLDVRWLWPGEVGEDIVEKETIAFEPFTYRYHPQVRARGGLIHYSNLPGGGYGTSREWTRRQRLQLDSMNLPGGHAFGNWWDRFHEEHPDFFALQPDGTRSGYPSPHNAKLCQSNPAVWDQWLKDVEQQIEDNPYQTVFNASPNDGYNAGICICENCRAWDHPDAKRRRYNWEGIGQEYVAMSDRYVTFANTLAEKLEARYPDKDYYVLMLAYGPSRPVPVEARPRENVIISSVSNFLLRDGLQDGYSPDGETFREQFEAWAEIVPQLMWRPNTGSPVGWQQGLPDVAMHQTMDDFKLWTDNNGIGIFIDAVWEHWATQGPQYYLMTQLTWDPSKDGQAILQDYYQRAFGPAADKLEAYWTLMEETRNTVQGPDGQRQHELPEVYDDAFFDEASGLLDEAEAKLQTELQDEAGVYRQRITFVRLGLQWSELVVQNMALMKEIREAGDPSGELANQVRANWEKMLAISQDQSHPHAINHGPTRPQTPRMRAFHPDHGN